ARVSFQYIHVIAFYAVLHVEETDNTHIVGNLFMILPDFIQRGIAERIAWNHRGRVTGVNPRRLDMLHDAGNVHVIAVVDRIHIYFYGIFQKLVDEKSVFRMGFEHALGIEFELILFDGNTHALAAQHVAGTDKHRVADAIGNLDSAFHIFGRAVRGEGDIQFFEEFGKRTSILGKIDHLKGSAKNMDAFFHKTLAQL